MRLKLVSRKDTLLGHIDVPDHWQAQLEKVHHVSVLRRPRLFFTMTEAELAPADIKTVTIAEAYWSQYRGAVFLAQGTLEEFEILPNCSFAPSAAYLRSVIE